MSVAIPLHQLRSEPKFEINDVQVHDLVRDLHRVNARTYWLDLTITAAAGWTAFVFAAAAPLFSVRMFLGAAVAVFALYRALCFMHEITFPALKPPGISWWDIRCSCHPSCTSACIRIITSFLPTARRTIPNICRSRARAV